MEQSTLEAMEVSSSPTIADGIVYFGSEDGILYALDMESGEEKWRFAAAVDALAILSRVFSTFPAPSFFNRTVYFGDRFLHAVDAKTGQEKWRFEQAVGMFTSPAIAEGVVYVANSNSGLYAIDGETGRAKWTWGTPSQTGVFTSPAIADGVIYFGSHDGALYAVR